MSLQAPKLFQQAHPSLMHCCQPMSQLLAKSALDPLMDQEKRRKKKEREREKMFCCCCCCVDAAAAASALHISLSLFPANLNICAIWNSFQNIGFFWNRLGFYDQFFRSLFHDLPHIADQEFFPQFNRLPSAQVFFKTWEMAAKISSGSALSPLSSHFTPFLDGMQTS